MTDAAVGLPPIATTPGVVRDQLATAAYHLRAIETTVDRLKAFKAMAIRFCHAQHGGLLDEDDLAARLWEVAEASGLIEKTSQGTVQAALANAFEQAERGPDATVTQFREAKAQAAPAPLQWLDMSDWDNEPIPVRQWAIRDRVPLNQVGLFSGEGGTGKSIIELMKDVAHVAGKDWLGSLPAPGAAFYLGAEDDRDEIHIRLAAIAKHYGVSFKNLIEGGLHVLPLLGQDAVLCAADGKSGHVEVTGLYRQLYEAAGDIKPKNISVDTLSRAFAGNEIDRVQVYAFAMHMQALAKVAAGSVTILSHPSLSGIASGSGISGSTAWHGAFRFRQYLKGVKATDGEQPEKNLREIEFKKNQYGPLGETIVLRYENGLFLPVAGVSGLDKVARQAEADGVFMDLLRRFSGQGQNVSHKTTAPNYAPAAFAKEEEAKRQKFRKSDFEDAMRRLFAADKIHVEIYGRPSQPSSRLGPTTEGKLEDRL
jgi:RecA-family ATPase